MRGGHRISSPSQPDPAQRLQPLRGRLRVRHAGRQARVLVRPAPGPGARSRPRLPLPWLPDSSDRLIETVIRNLRAILIVVALLFSQHAAMLHGLSHAQHELAAAQQGVGKAPALGHGVEVCAAFDALAHALGSVVILPEAAQSPLGISSVAAIEFASSTRVVFDPRAPPRLS